MTNIVDMVYEKVKAVMSEWNDRNIYAVSFFIDSNESMSYDGHSNVSEFSVSYNTENFCGNAGKYDEKRWNYAFWSQDSKPIISPCEPDKLMKALYHWYSENGIKNIGFEDDTNSYNENGEYIGKGPVGHYELLNIAAEVAERLQKEGFLKSKFGKTVPIIVHGLEYAWYDIEATKKANPNGEANDFLTYINQPVSSGFELSDEYYHKLISGEALKEPEELAKQMLDKYPNLKNPQ